MAPFEIRDSSLRALRTALKSMMSAGWFLALEGEDDQTRAQAALLMLRVNHAILTMENTQLADIRDQLRANETGLIEGTESLRDALQDLAKVKSILSTITGFLNIVGRVISIF